MRRPRLFATVLILGTLLVPLITPGTGAGAISPVTSPVSLVNPFAGTGTGGVSPGSIGEFPGASMPFGMIQWSPDTAPDRTAGSGYSYEDSAISGFSLTHLSGTGCASYGDVPILPTTGPIGRDPRSATEHFSHTEESAAPGRYQVTLGSPAISTSLSVTTRTGISRFDFPRTSAANVLFKVGDSASGADAAAVQVIGADEIEGQVESGQFCQTGTDYTLYFVARFDRSFTSSGVWNGSVITPSGTGCTGAGCGAYLTFNTHQDRTVMMKVGISFVSAAGAAANLAAEDTGWSLSRVEARASRTWNGLLRRVDVGGGTRSEQQTFYTALYHSLLDPNMVSDADGQYTGEDGTVHEATRGGQYANFSEWDIYRSEIQLIALLAPRQAGAMVQSLVNDAQQDGWLPKWAIVDGDASQMNGDSADPIIASAYAFGVRGFDAKAALAAMVKGATESESPQGLEIERQYLTQYLQQHYVDAGALDLDSINYSAGASMTLEYAIDDFSIAQLATALGDHAVATAMTARAQNWQYLFNPATGYIQARQTGGSFPAGPAFNPALEDPGGQRGFEEGNAVQYTWSVPQDLAALSALMGGNAAAVGKLDRFFTKLNAGRFEPYDWAGNEPGLWTPWEYDYFSAPSDTQAAVRRIMTTLYSDSPVDEPGNDDLGAMASWYVWAAMGLYPVTPGTANLALAAPLFPTVDLTLPDGRALDLRAPAASSANQYIHHLQVTGTDVGSPTTACGSTGATTARDRAGGTWSAPWIPAALLRTGGTLTFSLSDRPDPGWGAASTARPPSYTTGLSPAVGYTMPSGGLSTKVGKPAALTLGVAAAQAGADRVTWRATVTGPLTLSASRGTLTLDPPTHSAGTAVGCPTPRPVSQSLEVTSSAGGPGTITFDLRTSAGVSLPPVVVTITNIRS